MRICIAILISVAAQLGADSVSAADRDSKLSDAQTGLLKTFREEFVSITPGRGRFPKSFQMGAARGPENEQPVREVSFNYSFQMAKYEVPQNLYQAVMGNNPSRWKGPRNSVEEFNFEQTVEFCSRVTLSLRTAGLIAMNQEVRLPTEAEWEYCCRAGTKTRYSFGENAQTKDQRDAGEEKQAALLDPFGWHTGNAAGNDPPVGALKPNAWGLYDMHGYLWEFVADDWHDDFSSAPVDGRARTGAGQDARRTIRGGSWRESFSNLTSSVRRDVSRDFHRDDLGFRCVLAEVKQQKSSSRSQAAEVKQQK
jgi:formylglycine-generating enzyme required for sulfatase activity